MPRTRAEEDCPIIALDKFIQATRDSGYKGTASAISELVDNAIQAGAKRVSIAIESFEDPDHPLTVSVLDNGCGMDPFTLRQALRFGGSTRFGDRAGLGRYGMGLPNSSLSQARRVTVYTWQALDKKSKRKAPPEIFTSYLDVDEIADGALEQVPKPTLATNAPVGCRGNSGTLVLWSRCDRLDNRRVQTISRKLHLSLGRRFRHYLWDDLKLTINSRPVAPVDPLFLDADGQYSGAELFGEETVYEVAVDPADPARGIGVVRVRFSELPVHEWQELSNEEKRRRGISKGAGVSIVRAGREVDYGWFFMGSKRRENYDDWWRCEISFEPTLDEGFGITHTKQQVRPRQYLLEALTPDIEATARALNSRVRKAHVAKKTAERFAPAERIAAEQEQRLPPLPSKPLAEPAKLLKSLQRKHKSLRNTPTEDEGTHYSIVEHSLPKTEFFTYARDADRLVLVINPDHPFYKQLYLPLVESDSARDKELRKNLELLLLAAARSEASGKGAKRAETLAKHRRDWSDVLATFLDA